MDARRRSITFAAGDVVLMDLVVMVTESPDMLTRAPNALNNVNIFLTSLISGTLCMVTGWAVKSEAANMGSTAFLDVLISHSPKSGPPPVILSRLPSFADWVKFVI
jgi:hypothetical protein